MNFPLFVATRLYQNQGDKKKVSRPAITIATAGVTIGLAVMIVSVFVVLGFKHTIRNKVIGFGSHIQVTNFTGQSASEQYPIQMDDSMMHVVLAELNMLRDLPTSKEYSRPTVISLEWY